MRLYKDEISSVEGWGLAVLARWAGFSAGFA